MKRSLKIVLYTLCAMFFGTLVTVSIIETLKHPELYTLIDIRFAILCVCYFYFIARILKTIGINHG